MKKLYTLYILIITQVVSLIGSRMSGIAIGIWLYQAKGSVTYLLLIPFFNEFPPIIFGNFAGLIVDKWRRKYAMIVGDLGQGIGTLILLIVIITHSFQVWQIYLVVSIQGCFSLLEGIAMDASTTLLVPEDHRDRVNGIKEISFPLAGIIAPVLSGIIYTFVGMEGVLLIDFITFILSVVVLIFIKISDPEKKEVQEEGKERLFEEVSRGFKYLFESRALFKLTIYITFINFLLNGPLDLIIPYITDITGNRLLVSSMLGIMSFGAFAGAALIAAWGGTGKRIHTIIPGMILTGTMMIVFGIVRLPMLLGISLFITMVPLPISNALFKSIIQAKTPPDIQGRIFAAIAQLSNIVVPISFLLTGFLVDRVLEPLVKTIDWNLPGGIFGYRAGAGMGFLISITGSIIVAVSLIIYRSTEVRGIES